MALNEIFSNVITGAVDAVYIANTIDFFNQARIKKRAEKYWQREDISLKDVQTMYKKSGMEMPKVSVVIPARNESDVIRHTIHNISEINYPKDKMDLTIVTDEKEDLADLDDYLNQHSKSIQKEKKTTLEIAREEGKKIYQKKGLKVNAVSVPTDFDGYYPGRNTGRRVESTKGRALNYALSFIPNDSDYEYVLDADAEPDSDILIGMASKHLKEPNTPIMQGPIFQIGNYNDIGRFSKTISLYQAVTHDWHYPLILEERKPNIPFVGGTNYLAKVKLVKGLGGYDPDALCEDFDFGVKAWFEKDAYARFLPYPAIEQTPPTFKAYFNQRLRWRMGGLDVKEKFMNGDYNAKKKKEFKKWFRNNELTLARMQIGAVTSPWPAIILAAAGKLPDINSPVFVGFTAMNAPSILYPPYLYKRYSNFIENGKKESIKERAQEYAKQSLSVIPASSVLAAPWIWGSIKHALGKKDREWIKTPRTKIEVESIKDNRNSAQSFEEMLVRKGMDEEYALKQLVTYSHRDPKKSRFYEKRLQELEMIKKFE